MRPSGMGFRFLLFLSAFLTLPGFSGQAFSENRQEPGVYRSSSCQRPVPTGDRESILLQIRSLKSCPTNRSLQVFLEEHMDHQDPDIRRAAWISYGDQLDHRALETLLDRYGDRSNRIPGGDDRGVLFYEYLSRLAGPENRGELRPIFQRALNAGDPRVVAFCIRGISRFQSPGDWRIIRPFLQSRDGKLVLEAVRGARSMASRETIQDIDPFLSHESDEIRMAAIRVFSAVGTPRSLQRLIEREPQVSPGSQEAVLLWKEIQAGMNRLYPDYLPALTELPSILYGKPDLSSRTSHLIRTREGLFVRKGTEHSPVVEVRTASGLVGYVDRSHLILYPE